MSIATEIQRLQQAKADIKTAIENKGVEVGDGTIDTYADKIGEISVGGGEDDFIGVKYSDYSGSNYNLPKTADARSLDKILKEPSELEGNAIKNAENGHILDYKFVNLNANGNGGYHVQLEEVYLPSKAIALQYTFQNCPNLKTIHGDLSNIEIIAGCFITCTKLDINALLQRMPKLNTLQNNAFSYCTQITELTLPSTITLLHTGAFGGCTNITTVNIPEGWNCDIYFHHTNLLTQESLHSMIEHLADRSGTTAKNFKVGTTNLDKIDDEHMTMLENKNWNYS